MLYDNVERRNVVKMFWKEKSLFLKGKGGLRVSGFCGQFWFSAKITWCELQERHHFKERLGTTQLEKMFGVKKDVSKFRHFGCSGYMHLNNESLTTGATKGGLCPRV